MICNKCNNSIADESVFCPSCGEYLDEKSVAKSDNEKTSGGTIVLYILAAASAAGAFLLARKSLSADAAAFNELIYAVYASALAVIAVGLLAIGVMKGKR